MTKWWRKTVVAVDVPPKNRSTFTIPFQNHFFLTTPMSRPMSKSNITAGSVFGSRSRVIFKAGEFELDFMRDRRPELYGKITDTCKT